MRKMYSVRSIFFLAVALFVSGCFKDVVVEKYTFYRPVFKTRAEVRAEIKSSLPRPIQQPGKLFVRGNYVYLNDVNKGIHIIDFSIPASPKNVAFISVPGNVDLAVNGNYIYADHYSDLVTIDITNPLNAVAVNFDEKVFPQQYAVPDSNLVIVDWIRVDTAIRNPDVLRTMPGIWFTNGGGIATAQSSGGSPGKAGSMARFGLLANRLYTVSTFQLKVFDVTNAADPSFKKDVWPGAGDIETIYPFNNTLFLGSMTGLHIFSVSNPDNPVKTGIFSHATACDPVVTDGNYAYVTLRTGTACAAARMNQMDVVNVSNISAPYLVKSYNFTNPHGLDKDGNMIFLCDGTAGLRVLNASDVLNVQTIKTFSNMDTYDVIAANNLAITVAKDGLYFIDYSNPADIRLIGKLSTSGR